MTGQVSGWILADSSERQPHHTKAENKEQGKTKQNGRNKTVGLGDLSQKRGRF